MSTSHFYQRSADRGDPRATSERKAADVDNIFRLGNGAGERRPADAKRVSQPDLDAALDMLGRAAKAMDLMQSRYQQIEDYAKDVSERAERDLGAVYAQAKEWETRALASESRLDEMRARLAAAERRAELAERRAEQSERSALEAREWLECFYDKIVASFDTRPFTKSAA